MSDSTVKAVRATIHLGDVALEIFQMPDGTYRLSQAQVAIAVGKHPESGSRFLASNAAKLPSGKLKADHKIAIEGTSSRFKPITSETAVTYWASEALAANAKAIQLLTACAIEAIERRADTAFNVLDTETERQAFMKARMHGKETRREFTDSIRDFIRCHPELLKCELIWIYASASAAVNMAVFSRRAKELCLDLQVENPNELRNSFTSKELLYVREIENVAMRLVDREDYHPRTAVKEAERLLLISVSQRKVGMV